MCLNVAVSKAWVGSFCSCSHTQTPDLALTNSVQETLDMVLDYLFRVYMDNMMRLPSRDLSFVQNCIMRLLTTSSALSVSIFFHERDLLGQFSEFMHNSMLCEADFSACLCVLHRYMSRRLRTRDVLRQFPSLCRSRRLCTRAKHPQVTERVRRIAVASSRNRNLNGMGFDKCMQFLLSVLSDNRYAEFSEIMVDIVEILILNRSRAIDSAMVFSFLGIFTRGEQGCSVSVEKNLCMLNLILSRQRVSMNHWCFQMIFKYACSHMSSRDIHTAQICVAIIRSDLARYACSVFVHEYSNNLIYSIQDLHTLRRLAARTGSCLAHSAACGANQARRRAGGPRKEHHLRDTLHSLPHAAGQVIADSISLLDLCK